MKPKRIVSAAAAMLASLGTLAAETSIPESVLIIHSNQRPTPAAVVVEDTLRKVVPETLGRPVELYSEYLDIERSKIENYAEIQAAFLEKKYAGRNVRAIVASAPDAIQFALAFRDRMLPGVPIVHIAMPRDQLEQTALPPGVVGRPVDLDPTETLELALRLQPSARQLVIVLGAATRDRTWEQRIRSAVEQLKSHIEIDVSYLSALSTEETRRRLSALPRNVIVFTPGYFLDGAGHLSSPRDSVETIATASTAPVYGALDTFVGTGIVGGVVTPYEEQARQAGLTVVRLMDGTAPADIATPPVERVPIVDARQLHRFGIDERLLPPNAVVRFREPTLWDHYWREILAGFALLGLQAGLILALLVERRSRRKTAEALVASHDQMNLAARAAGLSFWMWDATLDKLKSLVKPSHPLKSSLEEPIAFTDVLDAAHPADRWSLHRAVERARATGEELDFEYRALGPDGAVRWIAVRGRADKENSDRLIGVALDTTDRKLAELRAAEDRSALRRMTRVSMVGQLSAAIAHQLNQPLASILGNAEAAQKLLERDPVDLAELKEICRDIVAEDRRAAGIILRLRELYARGDMKIEPVDLNRVIRETLELLRTELLIRRVAPEILLDPKLPRIEGGSVQLQQVVLNLVLNAADAMRGMNDDERKLSVRTESAVAEVHLFVSDKGKGIDGADLRKIFEPFWSTKADGMGVGLAICQSIISAHHGTITVTNDADGGATFRVSLPVRQAT